MKTHAILVLSDGSTWSTIQGASLCIITEQEMQALEDGDICPADLKPLAEILLSNAIPVSR